jgi:alkanesulfonate monooxygenase SsuD/methylene tetrahydromethanopterin reductase-like flavin-dependent oxidoreductase (luciferase family)
MRFGLLCTAQAGAREPGPENGQDGQVAGQGFRDYLDFNVEAEALGLHSSFLVEHHFTGWNQVSATLMLLTCLAMRTTGLRLGTAVMTLPWHHPVLLAEQAATLDLISGGRLDFGVGKGYRHTEFKGFGIAPEEAQARFEEALEVILRSWTTRTRFSHHGRYWRFEDIVVEPPTAQRPHPPLWMAGGSAPSIRGAAARGFNLILDQYADPETIGERIALYRGERERMNGRFDPMQVAVARQLYVARDEADKQAALARLSANTRRLLAVSRAPDGKAGSHVLAYAGTPGATERNALVGTPDAICRGLEALNKTGAEYVLLTILGGTEQLRSFARDIMPAFSGAPCPD